MCYIDLISRGNILMPRYKYIVIVEENNGTKIDRPRPHCLLRPVTNSRKEQLCV